jgi:uncharacterized protein (DUF1778 family)
MAKIMLNIRLEQNIKDFFKKFADKERRSLTNFVINAVLEYIRKTDRTELPTPKKNNQHINTGGRML